MKQALLKLFKRVLDKDADNSVWDKDPWCGDTRRGFHTEYEVNWEALDKAIDEFCEEMKKGPGLGALMDLDRDVSRSEIIPASTPPKQ